MCEPAHDNAGDPARLENANAIQPVICQTSLADPAFINKQHHRRHGCSSAIGFADVTTPRSSRPASSGLGFRVRDARFDGMATLYLFDVLGCSFGTDSAALSASSSSTGTIRAAPPSCHSIPRGERM